MGYGSVVALVAFLLLGGISLPGQHAGAGPLGRSPGASVLASAPLSVAPPPRGYLLFNVSNPSTAATGTFEQLLRIDSAAYAELINSNWTNGAAYYLQNGTPIDLWIESNASNSSVQTNVWVRLYSIPAGGEALVALKFAPKSAFLLSASGYTGESPLLNARYGAFDNGARVFDFYDDFSGTTLRTSLWTVSGSWTYSVNNGFALTGDPGSGGYISSLASFAYPETVDFYGDLFETTSATIGMNEGMGTSACIGCGDAQTVSWNCGNGPQPFVGLGSYGTYGAAVFSQQEYAVFSVTAASSNDAEFAVNYTSVSPLLTTLPVAPQPVGLAMAGLGSGALTNTQTTYWIRERSAANVSVAPVHELLLPAPQLAALPGTLSVNQSLTLLTSVSGWLFESFAYGGLPGGCVSADTLTLSCVVSGPGQFLVSVNVSDTIGDFAFAWANVTVAPVPSVGPLQATLAASPGDPVVNGTLTLVTNATGGLPPYSYAYVGLPPGCATSNEFFVSCSPTVVGAYAATVTVTDSALRSVDAGANVQVLPAAGPSIPRLAVSLTTFSGSIPAGSPVLLVASVSGGEAPYSYSYGGLPGGCLSADSASLSCTPAAPGHFSISVTVTDSASANATATTSLTLANVTAPTPAAGSGVSTTTFDAVLAGLIGALAVAAVSIVWGFRRGARPQ